MNPKSLILFILLSCVQGCSKPSYNPSCYLKKPVDTYKYPIIPGSPEWERLTTGEEMDSVVQIPEKVLKTISTEGLLETSLNYPMFSDLYFFEDYQWAFDALERHFNGFQELLLRSDAAAVLTKRYELMNPYCMHNNYPSINGNGSSASFSFAYIEILIAQYEILSQLGNEDLKYLFQESLTKYEEKNAKNYSLFSLKHSLLITARIMYISNYDLFVTEYTSNPKIKFFTDRVMLSDSSTLKDIYDLAVKFQN